MNRDLEYHLRFFEVEGLGPKTVLKILKILNNKGISTGDFFELQPVRIENDFELKPVLVSRIKATLNTMSPLYPEIIDDKYRFISYFDDDYPDLLRTTLKEDAPPYLFYRGNINLFKSSGVGFCGSRKASELALKVAYDTALELSEKGITVISGYASGVDMAAHEGALDAGGNTVAVLSYGINKVEVRKRLRGKISDDNFLALSHVNPNLKFAGNIAMDRNKVIVGLSKALIVLEAGMRSGTLDAGMSALRYEKPLFTALYRDMYEFREGNEYFLKRGAYPLKMNSKTNKPNVEDIIDVISRHDKEKEYNQSKTLYS